MLESKNITLGIYRSPQKLLETLTGVVTIPDSIKVIEVNSGVINEGEENERTWASLTAVDKELFQQFESIGQEEHCPIFKVKLKGYTGEDLSTLQDSEISFSRFEVAFILDKFKQPIGLALVLDLADISVK